MKKVFEHLNKYRVLEIITLALWSVCYFTPLYSRHVTAYEDYIFNITLCNYFKETVFSQFLHILSIIFATIIPGLLITQIIVKNLKIHIISTELQILISITTIWAALFELNQLNELFPLVFLKATHTLHIAFYMILVLLIFNIISLALKIYFNQKQIDKLKNPKTGD